MTKYDPWNMLHPDVEQLLTGIGSDMDTRQRLLRLKKCLNDQLTAALVRPISPTAHHTLCVDYNLVCAALKRQAFGDHRLARQLSVYIT